MKLVKRELKSRITDAKARMDLYFRIASDREFQRLAREGKIGEALKRALIIASSEGVNA